MEWDPSYPLDTGEIERVVEKKKSVPLQGIEPDSSGPTRSILTILS
jgi:hypothetical protein